MLVCSGRRTSRGPGSGGAHDPLSTLPLGVPAARGRPDGCRVRSRRPQNPRMGPRSRRMDYVHAEAAERGCPPDHRPAPRRCAAHSATAPFRPATPTPPGGHLSIAHPPRRQPAIALMRAFHPQVARPTRRPGALSAAEEHPTASDRGRAPRAYGRVAHETAHPVVQ